MEKCGMEKATKVGKAYMHSRVSVAVSLCTCGKQLIKAQSGKLLLVCAMSGRLHCLCGYGTE